MQPQAISCLRHLLKIPTEWIGKSLLKTFMVPSKFNDSLIFYVVSLQTVTKR